MSDRTYQDYCTVTLSHVDKAAELEVEVTFTQTPIIPARLYGPPEDCYPEEGGEREIVSVRPFKSGHGGTCGMIKEIYDCPEWLSEMLAKAIDVYALDAEDE